MAMEYTENILQLMVSIVMQVLCLFQYMKYKKRGYVYLIAFFLCNMVSNYYWTAYLLIMGNSPNVSDAFTYLGWNVAFATMLAFILHMKTPEERRFFHPLMLLPVPLGIYQLTLYLPYGGAVNSIYQVAVMTAIAVFSVQGICWYWKRKRDGARFPYVAAGGLVYALCEFGMWTSSCFAWRLPIYLHPYYLFSILCSLDCLYMGWAVNRAYDIQADPTLSEARKRQQRLLQITYLVVVAVCCLGGFALGIWIRNVLAVAARAITQTGVYDIITVVLFVSSMIVVAFAVAIMFAVNYGEKAAESEALREAKAVAEQASASKSEFLANMSHEIRTPINAILGMNEIILRESLESRDRLPREREAVRKVFGEICAYSGNIDSAGKNLLAIINDILDFSKIEAGKLELNEGEYRLSSVLNDVSNMIAFKAKAKGLAFRVELDDGLPNGLYGDEVRVRQIITNILNNAVKYTPSGSVRLSVRGGGPANVGETFPLIVSVTDTGIGIREADMDRLFDKFERVDLSRNSAVEGSGLGLAITQKLLDMMGGGIEVESVYGKGSTFTASIPQKVVNREPVGNFQEKFEESVHETRARAERFHAPDARILVVDDTRMNLIVVAGLLKNTEIGVDTAESGARAIELARTIRYDVILMDQRMPVMDGTEAMRRIREDALNRDTPQICLTADAISGAKEKYIAAGFDDYLTKPIDGVALEEMLLKYLPGEKVERAQAIGAADADSDEAASDWIDALPAIGIDPAVGLNLCQNDASFYRTMLLEYSHAAPHKARGLRELFARRDWENYGILAHSLKSTSRMIGAVALSDIAARMESAAGEGDGAAVDREHAEMLARFDAVTEGINRLFGEWEEAPLTGEASDDIIEFMPED